MTDTALTIKERIVAERDDVMRRLSRLRRQVADIDRDVFANTLLEGASSGETAELLQAEKDRRLAKADEHDLVGEALEATSLRLQADSIDEVVALTEEIADVKAALSLLRQLLGSFTEAETAGTERRELPETDAIAVLKHERKKRLDTARVYQEAGRLERQGAELSEVEVIERFLPPRTSEAEVRAFVEEYTRENHLPSAGAAIGQVMRALRARFADFDGGAASIIIRRAVAPASFEKKENG